MMVLPEWVYDGYESLGGIEDHEERSADQVYVEEHGKHPTSNNPEHHLGEVQLECHWGYH